MKTDESFEHDKPEQPPECMPAKALTALRGSIAKWEAIVAGTGADLGGDNCPLCEVYANIRCHGCRLLPGDSQAEAPAK